MTTQYMQKSTHSAVLDECNSWIERILARATETIAVVRRVRARQTQLKHFSRLSPRQLSDIGLDDPQVQLRLFNDRIDHENGHLEYLRNHLQVRR